MSSSSHHAHEGVIIPIRDSTSGECVHLLPDDLPDEPNSAEFDAIMQVLQAELARPGVWVDLAEAYYRKGRPDIFKMVLAMLLEGLQQESVKEALREVVGDQFDQDMLRVYNKLAAQATLEAMEQKRLGGIQTPGSTFLTPPRPILINVTVFVAMLRRPCSTKGG